MRHPDPRVVVIAVAAFGLMGTVQPYGESGDLVMPVVSGRVLAPLALAALGTMGFVAWQRRRHFFGTGIPGRRINAPRDDNPALS